MMLITARLSFDEQGQTACLRRVKQLLTDYEGVPLEEKSATARASLLVAMYIATGEAPYRNAAKELIREIIPSDSNRA